MLEPMLGEPSLSPVECHNGDHGNVGHVRHPYFFVAEKMVAVFGR